MLIPYEIETLMDRRPWANWLIITACVIVSAAAWTQHLPEAVVDQMVLHEWSITGLIGHQLLHSGMMHLLGNMIFLWVFGNALCANTSNWLYPILFFSCGTVAGAVHLWMDGNPAIGASGAVNGIVGLILAMYPVNRVSMFWWFFIVRATTFTVRAYLVILFWFAFDLWGALAHGGSVAYWAHVGGLLFGLTLGLVGLQLGLLRTTEWDNETLLELLKGQRREV